MGLTKQEQLENIEELIIQYQNHLITTSIKLLEFIEKRKFLIEILNLEKE